MLRNFVRLMAGVSLAALAVLTTPSAALGQAYLGPDLQPYAVMGGTTVTCAGASVITGDVGVSPGAAIVGFPAPCTNVGTLRVPPASDAGKANLVSAYGTLDALGCSSTIGPDLTGLILPPGVYCVTAAASNLTGTLTLNAGGNPSASWTFQMASTLITSPNSTVAVVGASACNVQWLVRSSATLDTNTTFVGNILALTAIGMNDGASLAGRALARNAAVTLSNNNVSTAPCAAVPPVCPVISLSPGTLPDGTIGVAYSQAITASGGTAPYTFAVTSGTLPAGLALSAAGVVSGTPTAAGSSTFTLRGTDALGCFREVTSTVTILSAVPTLPQVAMLLLAAGLLGLGYLRLRHRARAS